MDFLAKHSLNRTDHKFYFKFQHTIIYYPFCGDELKVDIIYGPKLPWADFVMGRNALESVFCRPKVYSLETNTYSHSVLKVQLGSCILLSVGKPVDVNRTQICACVFGLPTVRVNSREICVFLVAVECQFKCFILSCKCTKMTMSDCG